MKSTKVLSPFTASRTRCRCRARASRGSGTAWRRGRSCVRSGAVFLFGFFHEEEVWRNEKEKKTRKENYVSLSLSLFRFDRTCPSMLFILTLLFFTPLDASATLSSTATASTAWSASASPTAPAICDSPPSPRSMSARAPRSCLAAASSNSCSACFLFVQ